MNVCLHIIAVHKIIENHLRTAGSMKTYWKLNLNLSIASILSYQYFLANISGDKSKLFANKKNNITWNYSFAVKFTI